MLPACVIINKADPLWALCNERTVAGSLGDHEAHMTGGHLLRPIFHNPACSQACRVHVKMLTCHPDLTPSSQFTNSPVQFECLFLQCQSCIFLLPLLLLALLPLLPCSLCVVPHVFRCPQRTEESVRSSRDGVADNMCCLT